MPTMQTNKKHEYHIEFLEYRIDFLDDNHAYGEYRTIAESDEEAFLKFEAETGYNEMDILYCKRSAL
jgi:hypothetical protein